MGPTVVVINTCAVGMETSGNYGKARILLESATPDDPEFF